MLEQIATQVAHRLWPSRFVGAAGARAETLAEGARIYETLLQIFYMASSPGPILYGAVRLLNLCELGGPSPALARAYAGIFGTAGVMGLHALARSYLARATQMLQSTPDPSSETWVYQLATFYWMGVGDWSRAEEAGDAAARAALAVGNRRRWEESQLGVGLTRIVSGRFRRAQETFEGMRDSGQKGNHNAEQHAWILLATSTRASAIWTPRARAARARRRSSHRKVDATVLGQLHATEALVALGAGDAAAARIAADRAAASLWSLPPVMNMLIPHLSSLCDVYLGLLAAGPRGQADGSLRRAARDACAAAAPLRAGLPDRRADRRRPPGPAGLARRARRAGGQALASGAGGRRAAGDALRAGAGGAGAGRAWAGRRDRAHAAQARALFGEIGVPARAQEHDSDG